MFLSGDVIRSTVSGLSGTAYDLGLEMNCSIQKFSTCILIA